MGFRKIMGGNIQMRQALVIPHHHDNLDFLKAWPSFEDQFDTIYVILDKPNTKGFNDNLTWTNIKIVPHDYINRTLGKNSWIIPRNDSAIRSFGYWLAWKAGHSKIFTLDNDCSPAIIYKSNTDYWVEDHLEILNKKVSNKWHYTGTSIHPRTRGLPYDAFEQTLEPVMLSHGVWELNPDIDSIQSFTSEWQPLSFFFEETAVPKNHYFPMCGMNLAWNKEITPLLYFGLQGPKYPYSRFDDIWAGLFAKKILDHLGMRVITGGACVRHERQSNKYENLIKEAPGIKVNEELWKRIDAVKIPETHKTPVTAYKYLITHVNFKGLPNQEYWKELVKATLLWLELFR